MLSRITRVFATVFCLSMVVPAEATLMSRLGGQAAWDDELDITWLTDADLSGVGTWQDQLDWVAGLNTATYLGFDDWRLASMSVSAGLPTGTKASVVNCSSATTTEAQCKDNELGYMFYYNLGGSLFDNLTGNQTVGDVTLTDIKSFYWSGTEFDSLVAWRFRFDRGVQFNVRKDDRNFNYYGWAVRAGDVAAVPEPPMVWLLATGLLGLLGIRCRQRRR